jgi:hypothetical protein
MQFLVQGCRTSFLTCRETGALKIFGAQIAIILGHSGAGSGTVIIKEILMLIVGFR